jgi:hypothetical protein
MTVDERLVEAREALHQLQLGRTEIEIAYEGGTVKYAKPDIGKLKAYISELEGEKAGRPARGAIRIGF